MSETHKRVRHNTKQEVEEEAAESGSVVRGHDDRRPGTHVGRTRF